MSKFLLASFSSVCVPEHRCVRSTPVGGHLWAQKEAVASQQLEAARVGRQQESNSGQKQQALLTPGHLQPFILLSALTASTVSLRFLKN